MASQKDAFPYRRPTAPHIHQLVQRLSKLLVGQRIATLIVAVQISNPVLPRCCSRLLDVELVSDALCNEQVDLLVAVPKDAARVVTFLQAVRGKLPVSVDPEAELLSVVNLHEVLACKRR